MPLLERAWQHRTRYFPAAIGFVRPTDTLAISLTGTACALDCAHCGHRYLRGMVAIDDANPDGMTSCLISGGCDRSGRVPVQTHADRVAELRAGRSMNWHVGMIAESDMEAIAPQVDVVSFDFVVDDEAIAEVYGLSYTADDYLCTYKMLRRHARVVPHLTLGLRAGQMHGEYRALDALRSAGLEALVVLVFIPTAGTRYADCSPPVLEDVVRFLGEARCSLPQVPIYLGCMRPGGAYRQELDALAVRAGVNKIVNPARSAVRTAGALGLQAQWESECCVIRPA
jgi:uncharacterized radical SAM superfamily protein